MAKPIPDELDPFGFEAKLEDCSSRLKEMVAYLRSTAQHAGADVVGRRYKPKTGWGITYYRGGEGFCQFHPKRDEEHVWAWLKVVDPGAIVAEGFQPSEQEGWLRSGRC